MNKKQHFETIAIRTQIDQNDQRAHSTPIYATSSFIFKNSEHARALFANDEEGNIYTRFSNPSNDEFISKLALMEGTVDGMAMASGMAAMFTSIAAFLEKGDHLLISRSVFGSTHQIATQLLPRWGITHTYVNINEPETWEKAIGSNTKMVFLETPSNPGLDVIDLEFVGELKKQYGLIMNVDNCFATPYLQNPIKYGADLVTHSATKYIDGQGRVIGGAVLGSAELIEKVRFFARHTGPAMSPFNSWILSKSLETLAVRMDRHCENASKLAEALQNNEMVKWIKYPFLKTYPNYSIAKKQMRMGGGMVSFELKGSSERALRFLDLLEMMSLTANLGDTRSIATHPASTTHSKLSSEEKEAVGITDGMLRISVGLEHIEDIINDVEKAIIKSK